MPEKDPNMNIGQGIVLVLCVATMFISVFITMPFYSYVAPIWVYGMDKAQEDNIKVTESTRHYIKFSNGDILPKEKYWKLSACRGLVILLVAIPIFAILNLLLLLIVKYIAPDIARQILDYHRDLFLHIKN